jgi:hypothetical protein
MFRHLHRLSMILLAATTAITLAQQSPARPNFTGVWVIDLPKSSFGGLEAPKTARYLIRHLGSKLEMQYEQDDHTTRVDIIPDGQERVLESLPESENLARVYWEGAVLVFDGRIKPAASGNAMPVKWSSRWSLSEDKKVLTIQRHLVAQQVTADQKVVFNKQAVQAKEQ